MAHAEGEEPRTDADPFARFRRVFSGFFSEAHKDDEDLPMRTSVLSDEAECDNIMEFSSSVYYCDEGDGAVELEVVRLGSPEHGCAVEYMTRDMSAVAGKKYVGTHGFLQFLPGETSKTLRICILEDQSFDATLEFEVLLTRAIHANLGSYLCACRVLISDNDAFPTNRFAKQLLSQRVAEIPQWPLMFEFWKMNLADRVFRRRCIKTFVGDQITNLNFVLSTLLMNYLIDHVLRPADGSPPPDNAAEMVWIIVGVGLLPHGIIWILDRWALKRRTKGMVIARLQANLLRKFLSYNEASRNNVSTSDLTMAITRDVPSLAQDGLVTCFAIVKHAGLLIILSVLAIKQMGSVTWAAGGIFLVAPASLLTFLALRHHGTSMRRRHAFRKQTELVGYLQQAIDCQRLIADYQQGPNVVNAFSKKIAENNDASLAGALWEMTNQHFAPLVRTVICGAYILLSFESVLSGGPVGEFATGVALCTKIGQSYEFLYKEVLRIEQAMASLHNIVYYMNLPVDVPERMQNSRRLLLEAREARREAADALKAGRTADSLHLAPGLPAEGYSYVEDLMLLVGRDVTFSFPAFNGSGTTVLDRASFSIGQGQLVAVTGPRLGGKATLLHLLGGIVPPSPGKGFIFVPPHLRVLHVSFQPQLICNLDLFENLCFGPSDGADEEPERVLAICRRLRLSEHSLLLVKSDCGHVSKDLLMHQLYKQQDPQRVSKSREPEEETEMVGSPQSVAHRHLATLAAHEGILLSHTDKCVLHLARALVMNPDVLVLHKPLSHFDDLQASLILEILRNFVDNRGIEMPPEGRAQRRPRTCIFSTATTKCSEAADVVLHVGGGRVRQVDNEALGLLKQSSRELFLQLGAAGSGQVTREVFTEAFLGAPWAVHLLGIPQEHFWDAPERAEAMLLRAFDALDKMGTGAVDLEEMVSFLRGCLDMKLPETLAALQSLRRGGKEGAGGGHWEVPPVPSEASLPLVTLTEESLGSGLPRGAAV